MQIKTHIWMYIYIYNIEMFTVWTYILTIDILYVDDIHVYIYIHKTNVYLNIYMNTFNYIY